MKSINSIPRINRYQISAVAIFLILFLFAGLPSVNAQIIDPLKEYTNPEEVVTFDRNTTYQEAIEIINTFAQEYEGKFIVDRSGYSGDIGVTLPPMHWKDALQYILRFQDLELIEYEEFYEITQAQTSPVTSGGQTTGAGVADPDAITATAGTREIRINATFFEANKRALQEIGVDWSTLTNNIPDNLTDIVAGQQSESVPQTGFSDQFVSINSFNAANVSQNAFNVLGNFEAGDISVQALLSAFEANNLGKVLSVPSIQVVDGQEANIQVGQDFSIKQRDIAGNVTDQFFSTGTILNVTPHIVRDKDTTFVYMEIEVERSTAQPDVVSTIINKQEATTSAMLLDGEATHIAGLYRTEETSVRRGIPILKDLPPWFLGLRYIFGFNSKDYLENELIILVQAELVDPLSVRMNRALKSKRQIIDDERDRMRNELDWMYDNEEVSLEEEDTLPDTTMNETAGNTMEDTANSSGETKELTEEQQELAKELSLPVQHPELMVVVPKAFSLEEFMEYKENGGEMESAGTDVKYFVIGGSFIVDRNAYNFLETLENKGYDARLLYNTKTRFHFVAYEGYSDFDKAVERVRELRSTVNDETWLFTLEADNEKLKQ